MKQDLSELKHNGVSKVILDIVQHGQNGLTWRPIEAGIYNKKIIIYS